jgi:signal transduction histidine kinase
MRRRLVISTIAIVLVVLGALALPIGLMIYDAAERQIEGRLDDQATTIAAILSEDDLAGREPSLTVIRNVLGPDDGVRLVGSDGVVLFEVDLVASSIRDATRVSSDGIRVTVSTSAAALDDDFRGQLRVLLILALGGIAAAAGLAAVQAHQLAQPLERLSRRAAAIGQGDFSLGSFRRTRIPEIDDIGTALEISAQHVETMLANERHFTADATHQLRTGITGMAMRVEILTMHDDEAVAAEAREILEQTDQLNTTIDELLAAARNRSTSERTTFDLATVVNDHVDEWKPRFDQARRHIDTIVSKRPPPVYGTKGLAGQVIDILIDNALQHGAGTVTLMIEGPAVTVIDQGPGVEPERLRSLFDGPVDPSARHGRGLSLARRLAQVDGAALEVVGNFPLRICYRLPRGLGASRTSGDA